MSKKVEGFSKFSKAKKIEWVTNLHFDNPENAKKLISGYNHSNSKIQKLHDEFVENSLTNFFLPLGVAPNFLINGTTYTIPMAIEESSVIAAARQFFKGWIQSNNWNEKIGHGIF